MNDAKIFLIDIQAKQLLPMPAAGYLSEEMLQAYLSASFLLSTLRPANCAGWLSS